MATENEMSEIRLVGVLGAGTMGGGIAQVFATKGFEVTLVEAQGDALTRGLGAIEKSLKRLEEKQRLDGQSADQVRSRLKASTQLTDLAHVDLVVEAITENEAIKTKVWRELEQTVKSEALFASNTSSISITRLGAATKRPDRFIGMHFMNPVPLMKLIEIVRGLDTSDATCATIGELSRKLDKIPVEANDYPGFVANRILMPMINEAVFALMEGVASAEAIDEIMKLGMNHPMGPLRLADFIGLDVCLAILEVLHRELGDPKYRPCPLLRKMVAAGHLGDKSKRGFYRHG
jgi:3-hydroxybutyryl-CoA dehydrogenase